MISTRMLSIIEYLCENRTSSFKEIAAALGIKERSVRYDLERINELLEEKSLPPVEKRSKGVLVFPDGVALSDLREERSFNYTNQERKDLVLLLALIDPKGFQINPLARRMDVSRTTLKNDLAAINEELSERGLEIVSQDAFHVTGPEEPFSGLLYDELVKYIRLILHPPQTPSLFESSVLEIIDRGFDHVPLSEAADRVEHMLEENHVELSDVSHNWYLAMIFARIWYIVNGIPYPSDPILLEEASRSYDFEPLTRELSELIGRPINQETTAHFARFLDFTSKFDYDLSADSNPIEAQSVTLALIEQMSEAMHVDFLKDTLLVEGILSHMIPLLERIHHHVYLNDRIISVLGEEELPQLAVIEKVCENIEPLSHIESEDEYAYLVIYFLASIRRMQTPTQKRILLVCGHGYGTTTMLREKLQSEYQIQVVKTLPVYRLSREPLEDVDAIISTVPLDENLPVPSTVVSPLPTEEDYLRIESLGIRRKRLTQSLFSFEEKLDFLSPEDRARVIELVEKELGYHSVTHSDQNRNLRKLLRFDSIRLFPFAPDWESAVRQAGEILFEQQAVKWEYVEETIETMKTVGFYSVTDGQLALLHGKVSDSVLKTAISLVVYKEPVHFGDKQARILFFLASANPKEHIPAVINLTRMVKSTPMIERLESAESVDEIYQALIECEMAISS